MTHTADYYFLSRPRRFGKSLLISTLEYYFRGRKELFTGLAIEGLEKEWKQYPVIRLDMSIVKYTNEKTLDITLNKILEPFEEEYGVIANPENHAWGARLCTPFVVKTEEASAAGRADMVIETTGAVYVFEFKRDSSADEALAQIDDKGYLIPYTVTKDSDGNLKKLFKIGVNFDSKTRTLGEWKWIEG